MNLTQIPRSPKTSNPPDSEVANLLLDLATRSTPGTHATEMPQQPAPLSQSPPRSQSPQTQTMAPRSPVPQAMPLQAQTTPWVSQPNLQAHALAFVENRQAVVDRLEARGLHVVPNNGGANQTDCLIISLLQLALNRFDDTVGAKVAQVRQSLTNAFPQETGRLHSDDTAFNWLCQHVFAAHGDDPRPRNVVFIEPGRNGEVIPRCASQDSRRETVVIANWGAHFEAVANPTKTTWNEHLKALQGSIPTTLGSSEPSTSSIKDQATTAPRLSQEEFCLMEADISAELHRELFDGTGMSLVWHIHDNYPKLRQVANELDRLELLASLSGVDMQVLRRYSGLRDQTDVIKSLVAAGQNIKTAGTDKDRAEQILSACEPLQDAAYMDRIEALSVLTRTSKSALYGMLSLKDLTPALQASTSSVNDQATTTPRLSQEEFCLMEADISAELHREPFHGTGMSLVWHIHDNYPKLRQVASELDRLELLARLSNVDMKVLRRYSGLRDQKDVVKSLVAAGENIKTAGNDENRAEQILSACRPLQNADYTHRIEALSVLTRASKTALYGMLSLKDLTPAHQTLVAKVSGKIADSGKTGKNLALHLFDDAELRPELEKLSYLDRILVLSRATGIHGKHFRTWPELRLAAEVDTKILNSDGAFSSRKRSLLVGADSRRNVKVNLGRGSIRTVNETELAHINQVRVTTVRQPGEPEEAWLMRLRDAFAELGYTGRQHSRLVCSVADQKLETIRDRPWLVSLPPENQRIAEGIRRWLNTQQDRSMASQLGVVIQKYPALGKMDATDAVQILMVVFNSGRGNVRRQPAVRQLSEAAKTGTSASTSASSSAMPSLGDPANG